MFGRGRTSEWAHVVTMGWSAPDAGVCAVDGPTEVGPDDLETGGHKHGFEQPPEGAELAAEMLGEILAGVALGGIFGCAVKPTLDDRVGVGRLEVEDQVTQA